MMTDVTKVRCYYGLRIKLVKEEIMIDLIKTRAGTYGLLSTPTPRHDKTGYSLSFLLL